jgi:hypothetical protein
MITRFLWCMLGAMAVLGVSGIAMHFLHDSGTIGDDLTPWPFIQTALFVPVLWFVSKHGSANGVKRVP